MSLELIQKRLSAKHYVSTDDETHALREITQEIALSALSRTDFFKKAAFQGGTCLRILYGLDRFSEDLDFALLEEDSAFRFEPYLQTLKTEFSAYGYTLTVEDRSTLDRAVKTAFLKDQSIGKQLRFVYRNPRELAAIRIKLEVDSMPPDGAICESRFMDFPYPFAITVHSRPTLFAGKSHALLCRPYVKGRDWFDFSWYVSQKTPLNFEFLKNALNQYGPWKGQTILADRDWYFMEMEKRIRTLDWEKAKEDTRRFLNPLQERGLEVWSVEFFLSQLQKLKAVL